MLPNQITSYEKVWHYPNTKLGDVKIIINGLSFGEFWGPWMSLVASMIWKQPTYAFVCGGGGDGVGRIRMNT